jgi:hypothetical protein
MLVKRALACSLLVLLILAVAGCGGGSGSPATTRGITGRVLSNAGSPILGAVVRVGAHVAATDASGGFTLTGVSAGTDRLWVTADGYEPYFKTMSLGSSLALGDLKLAATPGVSFYSVQTASGSGTLTMSDLTANDRVKVIVATRSKDTPGASVTGSLASMAFSALPGLGVRDGVAAERLGLPRLGAGSADLRRRESERELALALGSPSEQRSIFGAPLAANQPLGYVESFWLTVEGSDAPTLESQWQKYPATLKYTSNNTYVFVDNRDLATVAQDRIDALGSAFDTKILPTTHNFFGSEDNPGVDNDPHIYIFLTRMFNSTVGYFWGINEYTDQKVHSSTPPIYHSNAHQMFFVSSDTSAKGFTTDDLLAVLAHEFQHMIFFHERDRAKDPEQPTWLNEGLAEMSAEVNGYGLATSNALLVGHVYDYITNPMAESLTTWGEQSLSTADYGAVYLFMRYFTDRFGRDKLKVLETGTPYGTAAVAAAAGPDWTFDDLFTDWTLAMALDHWNYVDVNNLRFNFADNTMDKTYTVTVKGLPKTVDIYGPWYYQSIPPTSGGSPIDFRTLRYGAAYAHVKNLSGKVTWTFTPADPAITDVIAIRHRL